MRIGFGPWEPDSAGLDMRDPQGGTLMAIASGVWPAKAGYIPIPSLQQLSSFALPSTCLGAFVAYTSSGGHVLFVGTATKLYKYDDTSGWVDYTRLVGGAYGCTDYWTACQFGSKVIFCNINDNPQTIDVDTGAVNFTILAGTPPKSRYVFVVGDFVVLACQNALPMRVTNSALNDTTGWTVGTNLCDQQDFPDGEAITGCAGGEFGWIAQRHAIRRMIFQPGFDQAFRFERIERERGAAAPFSMIGVTNTIYFLADDGFFAYSAEKGLAPIGHQRINKWFRDNSDSSRISTVLAFTDPFAPRVGWAFSSPSSTYLNFVLWYDWALDQWSYMEETVQIWAKQVTTGVTLEGLNAFGTLDAGLVYSLDSPVWAGGVPVIMGITVGGRLAFLNGTTAKTGTMLTAPMQLTPSARSFVRGVYPIGVFNDATIAIRVGKREHTKNAVVYTSSLTPSTKSGIARTRSSGRIHEVEQTLSQTTGKMWDRAEGVDIEAVPDGLQ